MRVGLGYDARPFAEGRPLVLGGVEIPGGGGLAGEPSGDAVVGAVLDALLGAAGLAGVREPLGEGLTPLEWLAEGVRRLERENYQVVNVDITVLPIAAGPGASPAEDRREEPGEGSRARLPARVAERRAELSRSLAEVLHARPASVSVKVRGGPGWPPAAMPGAAGAGPGGEAARADGGRGGIAVLAVALLDQIGDIDALHATLRSGG